MNTDAKNNSKPNSETPALSKGQQPSKEAFGELEKSTGKHPYSLYIIGTALLFLFMLLVGLWASNSDWVVKNAFH